MPWRSPATSGVGTGCDESMAAFAPAYAGQAERDFEAFGAAIDSGRLAAVPDGRR